MGRSGELLFLIHCVILASALGCSSKTESGKASLPPSASCAPAQLGAGAGPVGAAQVFMPDPIVSSGDLNLTPASAQLDQYRVPVTLAHLGGEGILKGTYVQVMNGLQCEGKFGAYEPSNQFIYPHGDHRFQEAMAYYFGDKYRANLDQTGYLQSIKPVSIVAHCELDDNAYFTRGVNKNGEKVEEVCLGDSVTMPGAFYGDDAIVTVHELQHATTVDNYSADQSVNQFWYDEAGALNEAISDFMGLVFTDAIVPASLKVDLKVFSRWALGTFDSNSTHIRGAHKCPMYDSSYPNCDRFPKFENPTSSNGNLSTVSYVYPDGMGWPFPNRQKGNKPALTSFLSYTSQEEIHSADVIMVGALWDVFSAVKGNHPENPGLASKGMTQLILESIRHLPLPNSGTNHSPISYIGFSANLVSYADKIPGFTATDKVSIQQALKARGLYDMPLLDSSSWMEVGTGTNFKIPSAETPGVHVVDNPDTLQTWLSKMQGDPYIVMQDAATGSNSKLDPGEVAAIWFDIQNDSEVTAGGVLVTVTSTDPDVRILNGSANIGYMPLSGSNQAQIMYGKINGTAIVGTLNPTGERGSIPIGNSYFKTNPFFNKTWKTAIWVRVKPNAPHGKVVNFQVQATPANGVTSAKLFPITIN